LPWLVVPLQKAEGGGRASDWPTSWSHWTSWTPSVRRVSAPRSQKRAQPLAAQAMGDSPASPRGSCLGQGGRAGSLPAPRRSPAPPGVPRRDQHTTGGRNPCAHPRRARAAGAPRLRVRTTGDGDSVHGLRTVGGPTAGQGDRATASYRLRPGTTATRTSRRPCMRRSLRPRPGG
jgi:hypothetical protein